MAFFSMHGKGLEVGGREYIEMAHWPLELWTSGLPAMLISHTTVHFRRVSSNISFKPDEIHITLDI